jgi:hypothetical protein
MRFVEAIRREIRVRAQTGPYLFSAPLMALIYPQSQERAQLGTTNRYRHGQAGSVLKRRQRFPYLGTKLMHGLPLKPR